MRAVLIGSLRIFLLVVLVFFAHRLLAFDALAFGHTLGGAAMIRALAVGFMSDIWIASLAMLLALFLGILLGALVRSAKIGGRLSYLGLGTLFIVATVSHQSYVSFFKRPIVAFHLRYFFDQDFLLANGLSLLDWRPFILALAGIFVMGLLAISGWPKPRSPARLAVMVAALFTVGLFSHNRNIHYRVQWFVPSTLQANAIEQLYLSARKSRIPKPLTQKELDWLAESEGQPAPQQSDELAAIWQTLTVPLAHDDEMLPIARRLKNDFQAKIAAGNKPVLAIALLESLRPSETGYFSPDVPSLTPNLDKLARQGIVFRQAYSTGTVTRGGQEAVLCGYLGGRDTSLMRGDVALSLSCLPRLAQSSPLGPGLSFWLHGGEGRFDSQMDFWTRQGIDRLLTIADFPDKAARTGWGIGDRTFFTRAAAIVEEMTLAHATPYIMGLLLSVSNHIPWDLPADAGSLLGQEAAHPSYLTTRYSDEALSAWITEARRGGFWQNTILIVVSDHGNTVEPYHELYAGDSNRAARLASHVNLILTGGLVEAALAAENTLNLVIERPVSQAGVAGLFAYLLGIEKARFMADPLLYSTARLPVVSDLEEEIFAPEEGVLIDRDTLLGHNNIDLEPKIRQTTLFYRAFLDLVSRADKTTNIYAE